MLPRRLKVREGGRGDQREIETACARWCGHLLPVEAAGDGGKGTPEKLA